MELNREQFEKWAFEELPTALNLRKWPNSERYSSLNTQLAFAAWQAAAALSPAKVEGVEPVKQRQVLHAAGTKPCDWPEDFQHENGMYLCNCSDCKSVFFGHKRRVTCKVCATQDKPVAWLTEWDKDRIRPAGKIVELEEPAKKWAVNRYHPLYTAAQLAAEVMKEREACAKILDTLATDWIEFDADGQVVARADRCSAHAARTIRARSKESI